MNSDILNEYGLTYSEEVTLIKNKKTSSYYTQGENEVEPIILELYYTDENDSLLIWDDEKLKDVFNWLISDDFLPFISEDNLNLTYYFKTIKVVKRFNYQQKGYLEVTFQPFSSFAYKEFKKPLLIKDERNISLYNYSNVESDYAPIVEIKNLGDESTVISMQNTTRKDEAFEITGLKSDQNVIIDMLTGVVQDVETNENLMSKCNLKFLKMSEGGCNIKLNGNCQIVIKAQFPIMV